MEVRNKQVARRLRQKISTRVVGDHEESNKGTAKLWQECYDIVADLSSDDTAGVLSPEQIMSCGKRLKDQVCLPLRHLLQEVEEDFDCKAGSLTSGMRSAEEQLLTFFPVMTIKRCKKSGSYQDTVVFDCFEFVLPSSPVLLQLLSHCAKDDNSSDEEEAGSAEVCVMAGAARKPGRIPHHIRFPTLASKALEYLQQHGWSAQERRRTDVASSVGVSLGSWRKHLLDTVPGLRKTGISRTTVHQLMLPPRQSTINAKRYTGVVPARVPGKQNSASSHRHTHVQHCASQVNLCMEFASCFEDELAAFSCDAMNKINIGAMAVSLSPNSQVFHVR